MLDRSPKKITCFDTEVKENKYALFIVEHNYNFGGLNDYVDAFPSHRKIGEYIDTQSNSNIREFQILRLEDYHFRCYLYSHPTSKRIYPNWADELVRLNADKKSKELWQPLFSNRRNSV